MKKNYPTRGLKGIENDESYYTNRIRKFPIYTSLPSKLMKVFSFLLITFRKYFHSTFIHTTHM